VREVGIRELKEHASEILREVREQQAEFVVTHRGRVVARLVPAGQPTLSWTDVEAYFAEWDEIAAEIAEHWPDGVAAEDVMRDIRRDS
jgi:prevent-host-death family protein